MLKDDFESIIEMLEVQKIHSPESLKDLLHKVHGFFKQLNKEFETANQQEKEELVHMLQSLQKKLQDKVNQFCRESGITEDQIHQLSQETGKLPHEQKELVHSTKQEISDMSKNIRGFLSSKHHQTGESKEEKSKEKKKTKKERPKWTKS
ncbi:MAG: hypothetical protein EBU93_01465 [Chlamydiae bacterium]|jgi:hypothetical protein|nr:hypothetical protein [Chlamydiota bacterium]